MNEQINILDILYPEINEPLPCDSCGYDYIGSCDNPTEDKDDFCIMGNKWIPKIQK
jgi:hypothetical protein